MFPRRNSSNTSVATLVDEDIKGPGYSAGNNDLAYPPMAHKPLSYSYDNPLPADRGESGHPAAVDLAEAEAGEKKIVNKWFMVAWVTFGLAAGLFLAFFLISLATGKGYWFGIGTKDGEAGKND